MSIVVQFHEEGNIADEYLKFAVIAARYEDKWIYCRHKERNTYEIPGGHREAGESIVHTAERELWEETGALDFELFPVCVYSVTNEVITYGKLFIAEVKTLGKLPKECEMEEIIFTDLLPSRLTYPTIQPYLFEKVKDYRHE